jgi:ribosomal protein S18 acetylase RimI-like enzyme
MPEIEIRPAIAPDIPFLAALDPHYTTEHVWQMEMLSEAESGPVAEQIRTITFRQVRLPRSVRVEYPHSPYNLAVDWKTRSGILVALLEGQPIGYASLMLNPETSTCWVTELVVSRPLRRQGIGSALALAALEWAMHMESQTLVLEMQPKNQPAIQLAFKLGFEFCGYNDRYYAGREIGIFFGKSLR